MQVIDIPDEWTEKLKTMSGEDAKKIYNYYNEHKPVNLESGLGVGATTEAALQATGQQFEVLPEAGEIFMGLNTVHYGNALLGFSERQPNKDSLLSKLATGFGNVMKVAGEETIRTANRSLEEIRSQQAKEAVPISEEERQGMYFRTVATVPSFAATVGLSMIPYVGPALGAGFVGTQAFAGATTESIESYKQEHPEDKGLEGYLKATDKEIGKIYLKTLASMASEYALGDIPLSKSFKNMLREGRALRQGIKAGTLKPLTKMGVAGEAIKAGVKSGGQEAAEELVEGLAYTAIDYDKINTSDELWERINDSMKDAVAAFFVAGPTGGGVYVASRANAISGVREALKNSMPEQDAATVAAITVDNHIRNLRDVALVSVQASTEFAQKRGEIYSRFSGEVAKAMRESGAFNNMSEEDFVNYVSETSSKFADNISGLAIQRKQLIPQVLDANKIVYKDGQLFLEGVKEDNLGFKVYRTKRKTTQKMPMSLVSFIVARGGIKDEGGELKAMDAHRARIGLMNKNGMTLDEAREAASEAGYFGAGVETDINTLLDAIREELSGNKQYKPEEANLVNETEKVKRFADRGEEESFYDNYFNSKGLGVENYEKLSVDEKKALYEELVDGEKVESYEDGTYLGKDGLIHNVDGTVLFQEDEYLDVAKENSILDAQYPEYTGETIDINGVQRTVYNSDGTRIAKSAEALRNFYNWFGESKVVDEQGRPLVVYHGTKSKRYGIELPEFDTFSRKKSRSLQNRVGFFFGQTEEFASNFGDRIMPVYLNLKNPKIFKAGVPTQQELSLEQKAVDSAKSDDTRYFAQRILNDSRKYTDPYEKFVMDMYHNSGIIPYQRRVQGNFNDAVQLETEEAYRIADEYRKELQKQGYDGVIIQGTEVDAKSNKGEKNNQYVVFDPNQIKSTSNRGTYSATDENIYNQFGGVNAANVDQENLNEAIKMISEGKDNEEIRQKTGWFVADDQKLRKEFSDKDAKINKKEFDRITKIGDVRAEKEDLLADIERYRKEREERPTEYPEGYLDDLISKKYDEIERIDYAISHGVYPDSKTTVGEILKHDKLYAAYPFIKDVPVTIEDIGRANGQYDGTKITISERLTKPESWRSTLLHEIQHIIQGYEGFARGGSLQTRDALMKKLRDKVIMETYEELVGKDKAVAYKKEVDEATEKYGDDFDKWYKIHNEINEKYGTNSDEIRELYKKKMDVAEKENRLDLSSEEYYRNLMGEVEAVDVQKRADLTEKQRMDWKNKPEIARVPGKYIVTLQDGTVIKKSMDETTLLQKGKVKRGEYNAAKKAIKLFKDANLSTIPHELAHYYLDNMWTYVLSGMASNEYLDNFIAVRDFLGIKKDQLKLTTAQHEKFASAYEKYLRSGKAQNDKLVGAFNGYDRWLKSVYRDINEIKAQGKYSFELTPEMVQFFDNMTTGELMTPAESADVASIATTTEVKQADDKTVKEAKEVIKQTPVPETKPEIDVKPIETEGKKKESRLFARVKEATEIDGKMDYTVVELDEQRKKAAKLWQQDPVRAENILNGVEQADDILRSALYTEQQRLALERGDRATFEASVRKQSAEATRMGQELSALRGVVEDITMPAYWLRYAENEAIKQLAKQMTPVFNKNIDKSVLQQLTSQLDADIKELYNKVNSIEGGKEKANALKEGITDLKKKYKGLEQPDMVFNQTGYEEMTQEYVEKKAKEALGIYLPDAMVDEIIQKARDLDTLSNQVDSLGLPTSAFFAKKAELEATVNRHTPTSQTKVALSIIGRSNMLTAPATTVLNVTSNASNYATQLELRRITNKVAGHTNDILVDENLRKQYRQKAWKVFWETGYDMSMLKDLTDTRLYKGESITHSEGDGVIRAIGRFAEKWVFSRLISAPDVYFKSMKAFTDFAANEATEIAYKEGLTGEKAKQRATEIWKDAILVEPQTEQGKSARQKAQVDSLVVTFQQDTELSKNLLKLREWINKSTGDIGVGDVLSPFVKTPTNILSMGFDATIGPFASPRNLIAAYNDVRRGQFNTLPVQQAVKQTSFAAIAYTVMALLVSALIDDDDYIPDYSQLTQAERNAVKEAGGAYGSVLIGGTYISTDFFGPFEMPLVAILNSRRYDSVIKGLSTTVLHQLSNAPVLKDFAETTESLKEIGEGQLGILEAVYDGVTNAVTTRAIPNVLNVIAKATDDYERETNRSAINKLKAKVPVLRQTLPEKVSKATGNKVETQPLWLQMLLGSRGHIKVDNTLANELKRLSETGQGASLSDVTKTGDLKSVPDDKKQRINEEFAKEYSKLVGALVKTSEYKSKSDEEKKKAINKIRESVVHSLKIKYRKDIKKGLKKTK